MSVYVAAALKRLVRKRFGNRCAYCRTAEDQWVAGGVPRLARARPSTSGGAGMLVMIEQAVSGSRSAEVALLKSLLRCQKVQKGAMRKPEIRQIMRETTREPEVSRKK